MSLERKAPMEIQLLKNRKGESSLTIRANDDQVDTKRNS